MKGCSDGEAWGARQLGASSPNPFVSQTTAPAPASVKWAPRAASTGSQVSCAPRRSAVLPWAVPGASPVSSALRSRTPAAGASSPISTQGPAKVSESARTDSWS